MSLFSEQLQRYMDEKKMSVYALSKSSGVERSFVHRIANGKRFPSQRELVDRLSLGLMLSPLQKEELMHSYQTSRVGEDVYFMRKAVQGLLFSLVPPPCLSLPKAIPSQGMAPPPTVEGELAVAQLLQLLLALECASPQGNIRLMIQPSNTKLMSLVQSAAAGVPSLHVRHVFCFDNMPTSGCINTNQLTSLMASLLTCLDYRAYYYHDFLSTVTSPMSPLPQLIITSRFALQLSADNTHAVCTPRGPVYDLLCQSFERIQARCAPLSSNIDSARACLDYYMLLDADIVHGNGESIYTLSNIPCLMPFFTRELYDRFLIVSAAASREVLLDDLARHSESCLKQMQSCQTVVYCTVDGVRSLLQTGRIGEIPDAYYTPLTPRVSRDLLNAFLSAAEEGLFELRVYSPSVLPLPMGLTLTVTTTLSIVYPHPEGRQILMSLREPTVAAAVSDYLESLLPQSDEPDSHDVLCGPGAVLALRSALLADK